MFFPGPQKQYVAREHQGQARLEFCSQYPIHPNSYFTKEMFIATSPLQSTPPPPPPPSHCTQLPGFLWSPVTAGLGL